MRTISEILDQSITIAVVGASSHPEKAAHRVPAALQQMGYRIVPINPHADTLFGEKVYRSLTEVPERIDLVDVFRPADRTPAVAQEAVDVGVGAVWLQLGIVSSESRNIVESAGLDYVEDRCLMVEARQRGIDKRAAD